MMSSEAHATPRNTVQSANIYLCYAIWAGQSGVPQTILAKDEQSWHIEPSRYQGPNLPNLATSSPGATRHLYCTRIKNPSSPSAVWSALIGELTLHFSIVCPVSLPFPCHVLSGLVFRFFSLACYCSRSWSFHLRFLFLD